MRKTEEEKDLEYFEIMKESIVLDLMNGRHIGAIMGSINRTNDWWRNKISTLKFEIIE